MKKIIVAVRASAELQEGFELVADDTEVDEDYLEVALSDWDAAAIDAASQLADDVVVVTVGGPDAEGPLREALALGAGHGVRIDPATSDDDPLVVARLLAAYIATADADAAFCGVQSGDHGGAAVPAALAAYLGWSRAAVANRIEEAATERVIAVARELEAGVTEVATLSLPAVVSVQTGNYEHKYPSFMEKRKAATYNLEVVEPAAIELDGGRLDGVRGARRVRYVVPTPNASAEPLTGSAHDVASQIVSIVKERLNR